MQDKNLPRNPSNNLSFKSEKSIAKSVAIIRKIRCSSTQLRRAP